MKDRWLTLAFALASFVAFWRFFLGPTGGGEEEYSRPLSTETRPNGYFAMRHWLETQGVPVVELRHRYDWLGRAPGLPKQGNLLISTLPFRRGARPSELFELHDWIEEGNALLVAAGLFDTPEWGFPDTETPAQLYQLTGMQIRQTSPPHARYKAPARAEDAAARNAEQALAGIKPLDRPKPGTLVPNGDHPLTLGVRNVRAISEYAAGKFYALTPYDDAMLALMSDDESGVDALWLTWNGQGAVVASGYGSVFTNKMLGEGDNARLLSKLVAELLGPGGRVIFDDMHQGAASFYDAEAFFGDPRLHASFWWIMATWLFWVLGSTRLPPPATPPEPVRERAFLAATGQFFARVVDRRQLARRMFANFFNDFRRSFGEAPNGEPLWPWMRSAGGIAPGELDRIEELHARVAAGRRVDPLDLHNRLQQLRKQLT